MLVTEILFYTLSEVHDDVNALIFFFLAYARTFKSKIRRLSRWIFC